MFQNFLLYICIVYPFHFEIIFSSSTEIQFWEKLCLNKNSPYPEFGPIKTGCLETTSEDVNWVEEHCRLRLNQLQEVWLVLLFFKYFRWKNTNTFFNLYLFVPKAITPDLLRMDDPMGEKSSISCRVRATFRLSESTNLIRFLVCVLFPVVVFCTWTLLCWLGCTWSLPGQEFQHQRWWMCSGTCVWGYCLVILSKEVFFHIISIWLEICSLMIVHLKLQYDSEEYVDVVRMGVHNYVEDAFLLDLPEIITINIDQRKLFCLWL